MNIQRAIAIAISALLLIGLIGAATVTAKDYSLSSKKVPPGQNPNPTTVVTTIATPTVPTTVPTIDPRAQSIQTPFNGTHTVPGRVQAEDYDNGGQNVAYYDTTAGNAGGSGRLTEAVDVRNNGAIQRISYIYDKEWTEYTVTVATGGTYTATFHVGSPKADHKIALTVDGAVGPTVTVPNTGSYEALRDHLGIAPPLGRYARAPAHVSQRSSTQPLARPSTRSIFSATHRPLWQLQSRRPSQLQSRRQLSRRSQPPLPLQSRRP